MNIGEIISFKSVHFGYDVNAIVLFETKTSICLQLLQDYNGNYILEVENFLNEEEKNNFIHIHSLRKEKNMED